VARINSLGVIWAVRAATRMAAQKPLGARARITSTNFAALVSAVCASLRMIGACYKPVRGATNGLQMLRPLRRLRFIHAFRLSWSADNWPSCCLPGLCKAVDLPQRLCVKILNPYGHLSKEAPVRVLATAYFLT
jgi:hypothetical protein